MTYNGNNYLKSEKSSWFDEDDEVDDEMFLKNSRKPAPSSQSANQNSVSQMYAQRNAIESRTLASTERSLNQLRESERVGIATAQELASQREQLERSSRNLDSINATLTSTQRNIDGIKSVFSSFKNYLTGPKETKESTSTSSVSIASASQKSSVVSEPLSRVNAGRVEHEEQITRPKNAQEAIDRNLSYMSDNITNLRGLALNLGDEIIEQNDMIDNMMYKADKAGVTINKQNTQMNRLLGKK